MSITNYLNKIKTAIYGKDVRGAIHDAIKECYDDASVNHDNANMEVKLARGTHNTLNDRLDNVDEIQAQTNAQLSHSINNSFYLEAQKLIRLGVDFSGVTAPDVINNNTIILQEVINNLKDGETLYLPHGKCCINRTIEINKCVKLVGTGDVVSFHLSEKNTTICKVNGDADGDSVVKISGSKSWRTEISNIVLQGCAEEIIKYDDGYLRNEATNKCTSYGLFITDTQDCVFDRVGATQCKVAGIYSEKGAVHEFNSCVTTQNFVGQIVKTNDGSVNVCHHHHNIETGLVVKGNYTRVNNCRFEWNGKNGVLATSGENQFTGNLFDRNGFAGLSLKSGWGNTIVGNYFSRNGCGGDGELGRWQFSSPSHSSYVDTPEDECCHIKLDYQRDVTITGNRYRSGKDDSNGGTNAPCAIYYCINAVKCSVTGDAGLYLASGGSGGFTSHLTFNSSVEKLTNSSSSLFKPIDKLPSQVTQIYENLASTSEIIIPFENENIMSKIMLYGGKFQSKTLMSEITLLSRKDKAFGKIHINNMGTVTVDGCTRDGNNIVITLSEAVPVSMRYTM